MGIHDYLASDSHDIVSHTRFFDTFL